MPQFSAAGRPLPRRNAPPTLSVVADGLRTPADILLQDRLQVSFSRADIEAVRLIERVRPSALRAYDQIPMRSRDLLRQAKLIAPCLAGMSVVFMGDADCASLLLGLLGALEGSLPSRMTLLDFDERLLNVANNLAYHYDFDEILEVRAYNAFERLPKDLLGRHDWFYTNPPYGSHNNGASAQLFVTRGCELTKQGGSGSIILPYDRERAWTRQSMLNMQSFLASHGWAIRKMFDRMHQYHLDDDKHLSSALLLVDDVAGAVEAADDLSTKPKMPYAGRDVEFDEIPTFYGRNVFAPYPKYIRSDGSANLEWNR